MKKWHLCRFQNYADMFLGISLLVVGVCTFIKPYSPVLWVYVTACGVEALAYAGIDLCMYMLSFLAQHVVLLNCVERKITLKLCV